MEEGACVGVKNGYRNLIGCRYERTYKAKKHTNK
jgi:hypothetical protein